MTKKDCVFFFCLCLVIVALLFEISPIFGFGKTNQERYEEYWNIELPGELTEIYNARSKDIAMGDGIRYTVFEVDGDVDIGFFKDSNIEISVKEVENNLHQIGVPKLFFPSFSNNLYKRKILKNDGSSLYIFFDCIENRMFVMQITI